MTATIVVHADADSQSMSADEDCINKNGTYACNYPGTDQKTGKQCMFGKPCQADSIGKAVPASGECIAQNVCRAKLCDGKPCKTSDVKVDQSQNQEFPSLSDTGDVSGGPPQASTVQPDSPASQQPQLSTPDKSIFENALKGTQGSGGFDQQPLTPSSEGFSKWLGELQGQQDNPGVQQRLEQWSVSAPSSGDPKLDQIQGLSPTTQQVIGADGQPTGETVTVQSSQTTGFNQSSTEESSWWGDAWDKIETAAKETWDKATNALSGCDGWWCSANETNQLLNQSQTTSTTQDPEVIKGITARTTFYAPGAGKNDNSGMQGGFITSKPNLEGTYVPRTLDCVRLGECDYVTLASNPSNYNKYLDMGKVTYKSPVDGITYTGSREVAARTGATYSENLDGVYGYVHDTGSAFNSSGCANYGTCGIMNSKFDVAVGDFRGWSEGAATRFLLGSGQGYGGNVNHSWQQVAGLPTEAPTSVWNSSTNNISASAYTNPAATVQESASQYYSNYSQSWAAAQNYYSGITGNYYGTSVASGESSFGTSPASTALETGNEYFSYSQAQASTQAYFNGISGNYAVPGDGSFDSPAATAYETAQTISGGQLTNGLSSFEDRWTNTGGQYALGQQNLSSYDAAQWYVQQSNGYSAIPVLESPQPALGSVSDPASVPPSGSIDAESWQQIAFYQPTAGAPVFESYQPSAPIASVENTAPPPIDDTGGLGQQQPGAEGEQAAPSTQLTYNQDDAYYSDVPANKPSYAWYDPRGWLGRESTAFPDTSGNMVLNDQQYAPDPALNIPAEPPAEQPGLIAQTWKDAKDTVAGAWDATRNTVAGWFGGTTNLTGAEPSTAEPSTMAGLEPQQGSVGDQPSAQGVSTQEIQAPSTQSTQPQPLTYDPRDSYYNDVPANEQGSSVQPSENVPLPTPRPDIGTLGLGNLESCYGGVCGIGNAGESVKGIQQFLNTQGADIDEDGIYGKETRDAVRDFQRKNGLAVDGLVGEKTLAKMNEVASQSSQGQGAQSQGAPAGENVPLPKPRPPEADQEKQTEAQPQPTPKPQEQPQQTPQQKQAQQVQTAINNAYGAYKRFIANPTEQTMETLITRARQAEATAARFEDATVRSVAAQLGKIQQAAGYNASLVASYMAGYEAQIANSVQRVRAALGEYLR